MARRGAMSSSPDAESLHALQAEVETFLRSLHHPLLAEDDVEIFDLASADWRLTIEFGKLIFTAWNSARSISRRIEDIAFRDRNRLGVFARQPGGRENTSLEFRERQSLDKPLRGVGRGGFRRQLLAMLEREYPGWSFERISTRSDREHSFSAWYTRGIARQGPTAWAFLGLSEDEAPAAVSVSAHRAAYLNQRAA